MPRHPHEPVTPTLPFPPFPPAPPCGCVPPRMRPEPFSPGGLPAPHGFDFGRWAREKINWLLSLVPSEADADNQLADKAWVEQQTGELGNGKADKVAGATAGNLAGLDSEGNLTDSGTKPDDFATAAQGAKADTAVQPAAIAGFVDGAEYNAEYGTPPKPTILLKHGSEVVATVDAADFVIDGMVSDVKIAGGSLVITFNTDSGKQPISIPLTDIFNPANYYTKTDVDGLLAGKASKADATLAAKYADEWVVNPVYPEGYTSYTGPTWNGVTWGIYYHGDSGELDIGILVKAPPDALSLSFRDGTTATRQSTEHTLLGYQLGSQSDKPLASEAEAEALRQGKQDALTFDNAPTAGSNNPVKSGGIWSAIWGALSALPAGFTSLYDWCVAQLAGKATKADATLTDANTWTFADGLLEAALEHIPVPEPEESYLAIVTASQGYDAVVIVCGGSYQEVCGVDVNASDARVSFGPDWVTAVFPAGSVVATRAALQGYQLGSQTNKILASEAEAEALRTGKQDALTAQQLANIAAVSDALAFDATHPYAAGDPVVYNGTLYTFTAAHSGAWTGNDVSAVNALALIQALQSGKLDSDGLTNSHGGYLSAAGLKTNSVVEFSSTALDQPMNSGAALTDSDISDPASPLGAAFSGKASRAPDPTEGNLAALDASGNPTDSGVKASDKLDATSAAPAFSSDSSVTYPVGSHVTYNGKIYKCTTATTGGTWVAGSWTADTMTDSDAVLDITAQNQLRVVAKDGTLLWAQGYDLASTSSATLACDATNNFTFADGATTQAFTLPTAPTGKVGDFGLDIDNSTNASAATMTLTGLDSTFSVVVPEGESLNDMLAIAAGELARFYISLSTFRVNNLPTWHILKQVVENGGATV